MNAMLRALALASVFALAFGLSACRSRGRAPGTESCVPGTQLRVACANGCGVGECTGDPIIRVCDGTSSPDACADGVGQLGENDDARVCSSGLCSALDVTCPPSGSVTVIHRGFGGRDYTCTWSVQVIGAGGGAEPEPDAGE